MKVILDIPDENLKTLGEIAKSHRQSRKSFMELVLITTCVGQKIDMSDLTEKAKKEVKEIKISDFAEETKKEIPSWKAAYDEYMKNQNKKTKK